MSRVIIGFSEDNSPQAEFSHMLELVYLVYVRDRWDVKDARLGMPRSSNRMASIL